MKQKSRTLIEMLTGGDLITPTELALGLKVSRPTIYNWVSKGAIPFLKFSDLIRFDPAEISIWIKARRQGPTVRCPYDQTIGIDFDGFEECQTCPVRQQCGAMGSMRAVG
jgi:excisionase family DNA binding protein